MYALGMDIGTSSLSAVLVDIESGKVIDTQSVVNATAIMADSWAQLQDPNQIWHKTDDIIKKMLNNHPKVSCIGLTGQMHGIVYVDNNGTAISPLYTWQDGRGDLIREAGLTYAQYLSQETGLDLATGYGAVTHLYNIENGLVPKNTRYAMTIQDYVAMKLAASTEPLIHSSNANSLGAPNWPGIAPLVNATDQTVTINGSADIPVAIAIGDNQASFIGSVKDTSDTVLINMGTGGQISMTADGIALCNGVETRTYVDGGTLLVAFSLCGGRAYSLLEQFFRETATLCGIDSQCLTDSHCLYNKMNELASIPLVEPLAINTSFSGTRINPSLHGAINGINPRNFTPAHFVQGVLQGMVDELFVFYPSMCKAANKQPKQLIGAGNGIRKNPALVRRFEQAFGLDMQIPIYKEEAAYGAALFSMAACGLRSSLSDAQKLISYI